MESAYKILSENISHDDMELLNESYLTNNSINIMKINLLILKQKNIKEKELFDYKGFEQLLINSTNPLMTLRYLLAEKKILTEFVCEIFNENGCSEYGKRISESLIKVAATKIFSIPEQSIMELPVNSVDSYNLMSGKKSIGKFGMGFFSMLYWISESKDNKFPRKLTVSSTYKNNNKLNSYSIDLQWTINGLNVNKIILDKSPIANFKENGENRENKKNEETTGTKIVLDCRNHNLTINNISKMKQQLYKLFPIEGTSIYVNGQLINKQYQNKVSILIENQGISVEDNATGISEDTLIKSLLVPSSSTKERLTEIEPFRNPEILQNSSKSELNIIVNGVCINNIVINTSGFQYNIYMPYNSKVPVSRDNIIYEYNSMEIEIFDKSLKLLINMILNIDGNLILIFKLLEMYSKINTSEFLSKCILNIRKLVENSSYILLPNSDFWIMMRSTSPNHVKTQLIIYDRPNIYDTEKKLEKLLSNITRMDIFKLRKVITGDFKDSLTSNGLATYLFISNKVKDITSLSMSNPNTLLIPSSDNYDLKLFDHEKLKIYERITDKIMKNQKIVDLAKILKMTFTRKFSNLDKKFVEFYLEYDAIIKVFVGSNELEEFMLIFITALNSRLSDISFNFTYGQTPLMSKIWMSNSYSFHSSIKYISTKNLIFNELIIKTTRELLLFAIELIPNKSNSSIVYLVSFDSFLFSLFDFSVYDNKILEECIIGINACVTNSEKLIFLTIFVKFINEIRTFKNIDGLSLFLVNEIRRKVSSTELLQILENNFTSHNKIDYTEGKILKCIYLAAEQFYNYNNIGKIKTRDIEIGNMYKFSCKSLIHYVYNSNINDNTYQELTDSYPSFNYKDTKLQIVEIAVNEGTDKSFINSVLTETVQNSVDAIRSTPNSSKYIDISISDNIISITDYVGFEDVINILIPFLSSKNPNDPNNTGENGTGLFNVYRQPFTRFVVIEVIFNGKKTTIKATPLSNNNIVYDIEYKISIERVNTENSTSISIFLNKKNELLSQMITDAFIFINSYLSFIKSAVIRLNKTVIKKNFSTIYSDDKIGEIMILDEPTTISYILTNDIPFMSLIDFMDSIENKEIYNMIKDFGGNSIIINLKKNVYRPTQARSKIQFIPELLGSVKRFLLYGVYSAILSLYYKNHYHRPDEIISFTSSSSNPKQLLLSDYNENIIQRLEYPDLKYKNIKLNREIKASSIKNLINDAINISTEYNDVDQSTMAGKILYKWLSNKDYINRDIDETVARLPDIESKILQIFVDIYWKMVNELIDEKIIITKKLVNIPPKVYLCDLNLDLLGSYSAFSHKISLNIHHYDEKILIEELIKIKGVDLSSITTMFNINDVFAQYFSPCKPATTILHEMGHAFTNTGHSSSYHDITNIKIANGNNLGFDDMCTMIYQLCVERGLINIFLASI